MKYLFGLLPLVLLLFARDCSDKPASPPTTGPVYNLGDTLFLSQNQKLSLAAEKLHLTYYRLDDSRCPDGVDCFTAGKAIVHLAIDQAPTQDTIQLEVKGLCKDRRGACGSSVANKGYRYQVLTVDPYPVEGNAKKESSEKAGVRLIVNKVPDQ